MAAYLKRDLKLATLDGCAYALTVGIGENYVATFVLAAGLGEIAAGLIATIPLLTGAIIQLTSPYGVKALRSHKRWVYICATFQALIFAWLAGMAFKGNVPVVTLFTIWGLYNGAGMASGGAWNTWIGTIIPHSIRARFMAKRHLMVQLFMLTGFLVSGFALEGAKRTHADHMMAFFAVVFAVAAVARGLSAFFQSRMSEPEPLPENHRRISFMDWGRKIRASQSPDGRLLLYLMSIQFAAAIAGPYFVPFWMSELKLSYSEFALLIATAGFAKVLTMPWLGSVAERLGAQRLLLWAGIGIAPLAGTWALIHHQFWMLIIQQFIAGVIWGGFELASLLLILERVRAEERTSVMTIYNLAHASCVVVGSLIGGGALKLLGGGFDAYLVVFIFSSCARAATIVLLRRVA